VPGPAPVFAERIEGDPLGLPSFRPLSFLSNLAERVLPTEAEMTGATNGHDTPAASAPTVARPTTARTGRAKRSEPVAPEPAAPEPDVVSDPVTEPEPVATQPEPESVASQPAPAPEPVAADPAAEETTRG
jgi:hypothetical protein